MESSSLRHSAPLKIGGLPVLTKCFGSRTAAGLVGRTWQVISHPNSIRTAASLLLDARRRVLLLQALYVSSSPSRMSFIRGRVRALPPDTRGRSRMPKLGSLGSVREALSNEHPYRERVRSAREGRGFCSVW